MTMMTMTMMTMTMMTMTMMTTIQAATMETRRTLREHQPNRHRAVTILSHRLVLVVVV